MSQGSVWTFTYQVAVLIEDHADMDVLVSWGSPTGGDNSGLVDGRDDVRFGLLDSNVARAGESEELERHGDNDSASEAI